MATTTVEGPEPAAAATRSTLARLGPFLGLVLVIVVFALLSDSPGQYLSVRNFRIVSALISASLKQAEGRQRLKVVSNPASFAPVRMPPRPF